MAKTANNGRRKGDARHVRQYEWMLSSEAYRSLSCQARCLLVELGRRFNGGNNGDIPLSVREAANLLNTGKNQAGSAFRELEDRGFIKVHEKGAFTFKARHATTWILTEHRYDCQPPTKDFMRWKPTEKKQKPVPEAGTDSTRKRDRVPAEVTEKCAPGTRRGDREHEIAPITVPAEGTLFSLPCSGGEVDAPRSMTDAECQE